MRGYYEQCITYKQLKKISNILGFDMENLYSDDGRIIGHCVDIPNIYLFTDDTTEADEEYNKACEEE